MKNKKLKKSVDKTMNFEDIFKNNPDAAETLMQEGMHCVGCPMAMHETLEQGAIAHGIDANKLVKKLNSKKKMKK